MAAQIEKRKETSKSLLKKKVNDIDVVEDAVASIPGMDFCTQEQQKYSSFFAVLRDRFRACPGYMARIPALKDEIKLWEDESAGSVAWGGNSDSWSQDVPSALAFLLGAFPDDCRPPDFIALVKCNPLTATYTWIGSGRDSDADLAVLSDFWLSIKHCVSNFNLPGQMELLKPVAPQPSPVPEKTDKPKNLLPRDFHSQEKERMAMPLQPYTYRLLDRDDPISVGPVRINHSSSISNKVKPHPLLINDRPPFVTFIVLVQDALARLQNGVGTKTDICMLVKDSQYVNQDTVVEGWNALTAVVSGALDRLQGEYDPPCKYMSSKKMWRYLHKGRSEEEFMRKHNEKISGKAVRPKKQPKKEDIQTVMELPSQEEIVRGAVNSILDASSSDAGSGAIEGLESMVSSYQQEQLVSPRSRAKPSSLLKANNESLLIKDQMSRPVPSQDHSIRIQKPNSFMVETSPSTSGNQQLVNVGGRQIILSASSPAPAQVTISPPQQQQMIPANIGGKTVLLTQDQFRKLQHMQD